MQIKTQKTEVKKLLLINNIHAGSLIQFIEESIELHEKIQSLANDPRMDFKIIQAKLFIESIKS